MDACSHAIAMLSSEAMPCGASDEDGDNRGQVIPCEATGSERSGTWNLQQQPHLPIEESVGVSVRTVLLYRRATAFALVLALLPASSVDRPGNDRRTSRWWTGGRSGAYRDSADHEGFVEHIRGST
ncbi:hypothetical protein V501_02637 [Pseudogymnoascus sp. VKM F-4519 (FW-2642)]|nr:hypothetical protein V501_02637 [Pseudogymnoascus sp. VKM F-4519 (FW-2642)]